MQDQLSHVSFKSHPVRVRGLKRVKFVTVGAVNLSHPVRVRGLKREVIA